MFYLVCTHIYDSWVWWNCSAGCRTRYCNPHQWSVEGDKSHRLLVVKSKLTSLFKTENRWSDLLLPFKELFIHCNWLKCKKMLYPHVVPHCLTHPLAPQTQWRPVRARNRGTAPSAPPLLRFCLWENESSVYQPSRQLVKHLAPPKPPTCFRFSPSSRRCWRHCKSKSTHTHTHFEGCSIT